jgi:phosphoglycolate phosphatase-like HAD superfamily hydrolase
MIKNVLWDFDGVILDSMKIRTWGFEEIFKNYSKDAVSNLLVYHLENGGLSRYVKIRYFYENILGRSIKENEVISYASKFSLLMKEELVKSKYLIIDSVDYIKNNYSNYNYHIVSGSDQTELRYLSGELGLANYFLSIHGSPTAKSKLVADLIDKNKYSTEETCLIGDSINDLDAATTNNISFKAYNNFELKTLDTDYINSFLDLNLG